jgi:acetate kinase
MNVLVFNCGSSSLKFQVIELNGSAGSGGRNRIPSDEEIPIARDAGGLLRH